MIQEVITRVGSKYI